MPNHAEALAERPTLADVIGVEPARRLFDAFAGCALVLPGGLQGGCLIVNAENLSSIERTARSREVTLLAQSPAELAYLTRIIGNEATFRLVEINGGCSIYIAKRPRQGCTLAREIGLHAARQLAAHFGGETLKVPVARVWRVATYSLNNFPVRAIALRLGVSEDAVGKIRSALRLTRQRAGKRNQTTPLISDDNGLGAALAHAENRKEPRQ